MSINRDTFFKALRASGLFSRGMTQLQVDCIDELLDACAGWGVTDLRQAACVFGNVYHETGAGRKETMTPVREGFATTNAGAIAAVTNLYNRGGIKTNYARPQANGKSYYGRGMIQITWPDNYKKFGTLLKIALYDNPDWALDKRISADIAVLGCRDGVFRPGNNLAKYFTASKSDWVGARNIVNGDAAKNGPAVANYSKKFWQALEAADEYVAPPVAVADPVVAEVKEEDLAPEAPETVRTSANTVMRKRDLAYVQQLLRSKNYFVVGDADGDLGEMTKDAILLFRRRNNLPLNEDIDDEFLDALEKAPPMVAEKRQEKTEAEVAKKVEVVNKSAWAAFWAKISGAVLTIGATIQGVLEQIKPVKEWFDNNVFAYLGKVPTYVYFGLVGLAVLAVWLKAREATQAGVKDFKSGRIL